MASAAVTSTLDVEKMLRKANDMERAIVKLLKEASAPVAKEARRRAPVETPNLVRPGEKHLKRTVTTKTKKYKGGKVIVAITKPNRNLGNQQHAHLVEHGYVHKQTGATIPGKRWWQPAVDQNERTAERIVGKGIGDIFAKVSQ